MSDRIRRWSTVVLALTVALALTGGYLIVKGLATDLAVAKIEDGYHPPLIRRGATLRNNDYRVVGKLVEGSSVAFDNQGVAWRCAPVVSARGDGDPRPRVYFAASETSYRRALAEDRFAGVLHSASRAFLNKPRYEEIACGVPPDAYVLIDDGRLYAYRASGRSLVIIAGVIALLAGIVFVVAGRGSARAPHPSPLPASRGEGT